jgi:hypothetical protein
VGEVVHHDLETSSRWAAENRVHAESVMKRELKFWGSLAAIGAILLIWLIVEIYRHA